ncbi:hypothetical protein MLD38_006348 [Melastoma candidum]|uniref:Uncharacterized protein n=1 Tax=Melastoma candidum TaxID=119954 RepID=A0ACB9RMK6_9MYRT|nr:hypothetical protein MLD38_006348 [Melastoma candidum]
MERGDKKTMKEFIRRTIMMQESMFKQQVKELHRLYYVQKRLTSLKEKQGNEKEKPRFLRDSAAPAWASFNRPRSENGSGNFPSVIGIKRTRSSEFKRHLIDDGCELDLSLGIRGKATKTEGEIRSCSGRVSLGLLSLQSSRSGPKIQNQEENFHHLQLQLRI